MSEDNLQGDTGDDDRRQEPASVGTQGIPEEKQSWNSEGALYLLDQINQGQDQLVQQINDLPDELTAEDGQHSPETPAGPALTPQTDASQNARTDQFIAFVKSSAIGGVALLTLFTSLYVQGVISINVAAPAAAILVITVVGFAGTWYDL